MLLIEVVAQTHRNSATASRTHRNLNPCNFFVLRSTRSNIDFFFLPHDSCTKSVLHFQRVNEHTSAFRAHTQRKIGNGNCAAAHTIHLYVPLFLQPFHSSPIDQKPKKKKKQFHTTHYLSMRCIGFGFMHSVYLAILLIIVYQYRSIASVHACVLAALRLTFNWRWWRGCNFKYFF